MRSNLELKDAISEGKPIILALRFDPGWADLCHHYEHKVALQKTPAYVKRFLTQDHHVESFKNTNEFLKLASDINQIDPQALKRTYIHYENDLRKYNDFIIGHSPKKIIQLRDSFQTAEPFISKIKDRQFLENLEDPEYNADAREKRISTFPRLIMFEPSHKTMQLKKGSINVLISTCLTDEGTGKDNEGDLIGIFNLQVTDNALRHKIAHNERSGIILVPYVRPDQINESIEHALMENSGSTSFPIIQGKVTNSNQFARVIPDDLLRTPL